VKELAVKPFGIPVESRGGRHSDAGGEAAERLSQFGDIQRGAAGVRDFWCCMMAFREWRANLPIALNGGGFRIHVERIDEVCAKGVRYSRIVSRAAVSASFEGHRRFPGNADVERCRAAEDHGADELSFVREHLARLFADAPLSQLGSWVTEANYESGPIQEAVRRIGRKVGENIMLGTVTDIYVEIVDILRAKQPLQYYTTVGTKVLLSIPASVLPLLSGVADEDIARIYRKTLRLKKIDRGVSSLDRLKAGI